MSDYQLNLIHRLGQAEEREPGHGPAFSEDERRTYDLLHATLGAAVPLNMLFLSNSSFEERVEFIQGDAQIIASEGDNILFRGARKGDTARAFNALARALAVLSFQPGGVRAFGHHFEAPGPTDPPLAVQLDGPWTCGRQS